MRKGTIVRAAWVSVVLMVGALAPGCTTTSSHDIPPSDGVVRKGIIEIYRGDGVDSELVGAYTTVEDSPGSRLWILDENETPHIRPQIGETLQFVHYSEDEVLLAELCNQYGNQLGAWKLWDGNTQIMESPACDSVGGAWSGDPESVPPGDLDPPANND